MPLDYLNFKADAVIKLHNGMLLISVCRETRFYVDLLALQLDFAPF